jgi:hypothetical protein
MVQQRIVELEFKAGEMPVLECALCGYEPIKYGSSVCQGCKHEIAYLDRVKSAKPSVATDIFGGLIATAVFGAACFYGISFFLGASYTWIAIALSAFLVFGAFGVYFDKRKQYRSLLEQQGRGRELVSVIFGTASKQYRVSGTSTGIIVPLNND